MPTAALAATQTARTVLSKDGTALAYDVLGHGPPLVVVNGALGVRSFTFAQRMAEELAKRFTVYSYDRRGRGDSGDTAPYSVQREVEDVAAMAKAAGGRPCVFGMISGAALALEAAAAGVPMAGLVAYEPPYTKADPDDTTDVGYEDKVRALVERGDRDGAVALFMRTVGVPGVGVAVMRLLPMWKVMREAAPSLPYDAAVMDRFRVPTDRLARIKAPTVVANGAKTTRTLKLAAEAAAKAIPGGRHVVVPKANHGVKGQAILPVLAEAFGLPATGSPGAQA